MTTNEEKRHACLDCRQCQGCAETRCRVCRGQGAEQAEPHLAGLSMAEQIALYESLNREPAEACACGRERRGRP